MMIVPKIEGNTHRDIQELGVSSPTHRTNVENVDFLDFVRNAITQDDRNENTFVHQEESRIESANNNNIPTFDESIVLGKRQGRESESESIQTNRENSFANNDVPQHKSIKPSREETRISDEGVGPVRMQENLRTFVDRREEHNTRMHHSFQRERDYVVKGTTSNNDKMPRQNVEPIVHTAILAIELARELPVQFHELKQALRIFSKENGQHNVAKRSHVVNNLFSKAQQALNTLSVENGESRSETNSSMQLKQKLYALIESLDRVRRQSAESPVEMREHRVEQKNVAEVTVRHFSNGFESRNEATRYAESAMRVDGMPNALGRSNTASNLVPAAKQFPFIHEQFEMLLQQARIVVRDAQNGSFTMNLYPESLGRVNVNLGLEEGILVGRFLVESQHAREAILESLERLIAQLAEAGIEVGSFQVNVRGERDRLVQELQGYISERNAQFSSNRGGQYEVQSMREHDGILDVIV